MNFLQGGRYFTMIVYQGEELKSFIDESLNFTFKERFLLKDLHAYMTSGNNRKACCLYGLRRTGKTIMMLQEIKNLGDYKNSLLIRCFVDDSMWQVGEAVEEAIRNSPGLKYVFIDEITRAKRFINTCSFLADDYAMRGIKVVLSGTDSLGFLIAEGDELFDRITFLHTTYIPFAEYNYLLGKSIMDYIRYGGTLTDGEENVFYNSDRAALYTNSAIVYNISNTITRWNDGSNYACDVLRDIMAHNDLSSAIRKVIEYHNRKFLADIINADFKSHDLGSLIELMSKPGSGLGNPEIVDTEAMNDRVRIFLGIKEHLYSQIDKNAVDAIIGYLKKLDVLYPIPKTGGLDAVKDEEYLFTQVGMRHCQAAALADALITSEEFEGYTKKQRELMIQKIESDINGQILEDIVFYQAARDLGCRRQPDRRHEVSKYRNLEGREIDLLIMDFCSETVLAIEVKLSREKAAGQRKHLMDMEVCGDIEAKTGLEIANKAVVYLGENGESEDGVLYINAEDFLKRSKEMAQALLEHPQIESFRQLKDILDGEEPEDGLLYRMPCLGDGER